MPKRGSVRMPDLNPGLALEILSRGRKGASARPIRLDGPGLARIARTVSRVPEVVVKVSGGAPDAGGVKAHLKYISRHGKEPLLTDHGEKLHDKKAAGDLLADWNLDALPARKAGQKGGRGSPKAVHNIVLSMPAKVDPQKVLSAAQAFARENFALMHRYAMVLHTDTEHPHVHLVVKAEREDGRGRMNIRKPMLREWREQFARELRALGVPANATSAAERGGSRSRLRDAMLRAELRSTGNSKSPGSRSSAGSTYLRKRVREVAEDLRSGRLDGVQRGKSQISATRQAVIDQWTQAEARLRAHGQDNLADAVGRFVAGFAPVRTDQERIAQTIIARQRQQKSGNPSTPSRGEERDVGATGPGPERSDR